MLAPSLTPILGVFVSQADTSLILATNGEIASEFDSLDKASWLMTSFILAMCVCQPMVYTYT